MMTSHSSRQHTVDSLFTLSLLGVFAISALLVTVFGANTYEKIVAKSSSIYEAGTSLSYIREKIRQNDTADSVSILQIEDTDVLCLKSNVNDRSYVTYIYWQDGALKELYQQEGYDLPLSAGQQILSVDGLEMKQLSDSLLYVAVTDKSGARSELTLQLNSVQ